MDEIRWMKVGHIQCQLLPPWELLSSLSFFLRAGPVFSLISRQVVKCLQSRKRTLAIAKATRSHSDRAGTGPGCRRTWVFTAIGRRGKMSARKMVRANPLSDLRVFMHLSSAPPVFVCCQGSPLVSYGSGAPEVDFCQWRRGHGLRRGKRFGGNGFRVLGFSSCRGGSECMCMCLCMYMGVVWMMDGDVISVTACQAIANIVKTSLGPVGLDKVRFLCYLCIFMHFGLSSWCHSLIVTLVLFLPPLLASFSCIF